MAKLTFNNSNDLFFKSLKRSVEAYFKENGIRKTGNWKLYLKTIVLIPLAILTYVSLLTFPLPAAPALLLCAVLGILIASIGFNVMHDACHGSYSDKKWVNNIMSLTMNALGGNAFLWKQKHNILHHTYTNIQGLDDDIAQSKLLRQSPSQEWMPIHKYQHLYLTAAYSLSLFLWVGFNDFKKYFFGRINTTPLPPMKRQEHFIFWISKFCYAIFYIAIPIYFVGFLPWLAGYVTMMTVAGIVLSYTFQLAHAVEGPEFESAGIEDKMLETEWAVHQIKTTANFSPNNKVISWFVGGLNFQIEHHLFPRISHVHYGALSKIVKEHCEKFNLPYHSFSNVKEALASHVRTMKKLGQNEWEPKLKATG
jgi:linoleoyl-CoA desaturase